MLLVWSLACGPKGALVYQVYDGDQRVLTFSEGAGPLLSTAALPPGTEPRQHPFVNGRAHSALHENQLHLALTGSATPGEFIENLEAAGLRVERDKTEK